MDVCVEIFYAKTTGKTYEGSITSVRPVKGAVWNGSEYVRNNPVGNPSHIYLYITGVPITNYLTLSTALERWSRPTNDRPEGDPLEWSMKDSKATAAEKQDILAQRYTTVTWSRFKELISNLADVPFADSDLRTEHES